MFLTHEHTYWYLKQKQKDKTGKWFDRTIVCFGKTKPSFQMPFVYRGCAEDLINGLKDKSINLILTDPPYGITQNILKNRWLIAEKLFYIKDNWDEYKKQDEFPYKTFKQFIKHYYGWTKQEAYTYLDAQKFKLLLIEKSQAGLTLLENGNNNISITTADKLYELSELDTEKSIEIIEDNPDITRREVEQIIKELKENNSDFIPKIYDVWNFSGCDDRFGSEYPGRIPGQLIMNCLYYYTKKKNVVIDFMAGSGITHDACKFMDRKCYSFDINPVRDFIIKHDLIQKNNIVLPKLKEKPTLIFVDPPYWTMKREKYDGGFSDVSLDIFYKRIELFARKKHPGWETWGNEILFCAQQHKKELNK